MAHKETAPPFKCLGSAKDHNGVDLNQTKRCIKISCLGCIHRITQARGWEEHTCDEITSCPITPSPEKALEHIFKDQGPIEGSKEWKQLQNTNWFCLLCLTW